MDLAHPLVVAVLLAGALVILVGLLLAVKKVFNLVFTLLIILLGALLLLAALFGQDLGLWEQAPLPSPSQSATV